ncbi:MAG: hypothetical protein K2G97_00360, partial [Oscillospiraceae bacterium]|nr:hypothetical protein [Oscillospiraceae bacterium]
IKYNKNKDLYNKKKDLICKEWKTAYGKIVGEVDENITRPFLMNDDNHEIFDKIEKSAEDIISKKFSTNISSLKSMIESKNPSVMSEIESSIESLIESYKYRYAHVIDTSYRSEIESVIKEAYIDYLKMCSDNNVMNLSDELMKTFSENFNKRFMELGQKHIDDYCESYKKSYNDLYNLDNKEIKSLNFWFCTSLISAFFGGTTSGATAGLTAGSKCTNIGAFCGVNAGEISKCSANNSSFKAKTLYNKYNMCGGFVGINEETGVIKDSVATGSEISNKTYTGGHLGGFAGENSGKIENGTTQISVANGKCAGGFCGNNKGEISGSRSEGNATANAKTVETKCGGFVGNNDKQGKISSCTSTGSVTGQEYVGGFCGDNKGEISKSNSEGNAKASTKVNTNRCGGFIGENSGNINDCNSTGSATGEEYVGGFAGVNKSEIVDCNAHGKATAKTKTHTALAGGFVGENEKGIIVSCTATGGADS